MSDSNQERSSVNADPSWSKGQRSKKLSGRKQTKSTGTHVSSHLRSSSHAQPVAGKPPESISTQRRPEQHVLGGQGASGLRLFLDFQSLRIMKEDADEDSASDLSDSERVAIPPSPLTPPDLRLRAEEIDPVSFDLHPDPSQAKAEYCYPDFLPPPFSSWDLQDMAVLLNTECRSGAVARAAGPLGKYIDRLLQLEWLQVQTVQWEKARATKARSLGVPGPSGALRSPGRSKLLAGALSKPLPPSAGASKAGPSRKKGFHQGEAHPSCCASEPSPRPEDVPARTRLGFQKQIPEVRKEVRKKLSKGAMPQPRDLPYRNGSPGMEANGNIRIPKQAPMLLDPVDSHGAPRTQAHAELKKKGTAAGCGLAASSREKKLKTNGTKPSARRSEPSLTR
uniref:protein FAM217B isoform X1 n=1 Tax=Jaculus jaculus TaxID=51337 RepID=UPI001E1B5189|nr:protein FAM217B isoform X1 [Jaculus jaculus]XP_045013258.1 protein FAM217B isoform X1 [Jaculus jaculus]